MPLQAFSFPFPETRCFRAGSLTYKCKIRAGSSFSGEEVLGGNCFDRELEEIIRTVLGNLDSLQPFSSAHFNVFPYKKRWEGASKAMCKLGERKLRAYPFSLILYLEKNTQNEEAKEAAEKLSPPQLKRRRTDSPLEEAIIKDLLKDMEAEGEDSVVRRPSLHCPHADREIKEDPWRVDKKAFRGFEEPQQKYGVNTVGGSGTPGEVHPGTTQHMGEEEEEEEGENADSVPGTPVRPGILTRLASYIFPFLFFRDS
ncbi:membrane-anchored junction protein isoform X3 [Sebastes umbrosus]|uniref:membrane-anchored junction protein isoform X3 n=1 Tax=Sebastes umbrosus TaxID=72105 RepID=UPI00189FF56F|nr:membrane-anchored junction protein isoform X3 [Sebastes umbrosus]